MLTLTEMEGISPRGPLQTGTAQRWWSWTKCRCGRGRVERCWRGCGFRSTPGAAGHPSCIHVKPKTGAGTMWTVWWRRWMCIAVQERPPPVRNGLRKASLTRFGGLVGVTWMASGCGRPPNPTALELISGCNHESPKEQELDENGKMRIGRALGTGVQFLVQLLWLCCPLQLLGLCSREQLCCTAPSQTAARSRSEQCWLKKQKDVMAPSVIARGEDVMWTSGLIFAKGEGIVGLETNLGTLHIQLLPGCAPRSVDYFIELLGLRNFVRCRFYRAEGRGNVWDENGDHEKNVAFGPPYALLQGTLEVDGVPFKEIPREACPAVKRGSVAWVGSGPEFLISLADHEEWRDAYTVFGNVLPKDMAIAEEMALLPTSTDLWSNVTVKVLKDPVYFKVKRSSNASAV